ncbi:MAG: hypothetical protein KDK36_20560 [Leptospiraceae bacterium]|nr:hypothetical protein [Leptospiraceae bacterium]
MKQKVPKMFKPSPKNIFNLFDDFFKEINPFRVIIGAVEETKDNYRVEIDMRYLNELVHLEVLEKAENLIELDFFASEGKVIIKGDYYVGDYRLAGIFKVREIEFHSELVPVWVKGNRVRFRISTFDIWNKKKKKFDIVKWIAKLIPYNRTYILKELVSLYPKILSLTRFQNEIRLNLSFFLNKAKINPEGVKIHRLNLEKNKLVFDLRSSVVLKPLADLFGSSVVSVISIPERKSLRK